MGGTRTALVLMALALGACGEKSSKAPAGDAGGPPGGDGSPADGSPADGSPGDAGQDAAIPRGPVGTIKGRVLNVDGTEAVQVEVAVGDQKVRTDSRGVFVASDVKEGPAKVGVESSTVSAAQVNVAVQKDKTSQVDLTVLPLVTVEVADSTKAGNVAGPDGVVVALEDKALKKKRDGTPSEGKAQARYGLVTTGQDIKAAPGGMKAKMGDQTVQLEAFGMIDLRFYQDEDELDLAKPATLDLPLGPNAFVMGDEVDVFSFDEATGFWTPEGRATIDRTAGNGFARLTLPHLSWWTVGAPLPATGCLAGKLVTNDDPPKPIEGMAVNAAGVDYWGTSYATTDAEGAFCLDVKLGSQTTLSAFGSSGQSYFEWTQAITSTGETSACGGTGTCTDVGAVTGVSLFDDCQGDVTSDQNHVLVMSSGDPALDTAVQGALEGFGHTVTVGVPYHMFDGTVALDAYDAVYLQANYNWSSGDMPVAGQRQLINWVNCGGGLVTTEWTTWKIGSNAFQLIDAIFPNAKTTAFGSPTSETYVQVTPDATLNAGLPESFTFTTTSYSGTESNLNPRPGAVIYYDSMTLDSGLIGWTYNLGRVASFSTTVGTNDIADPNMSRLVANTLDWVQRD